MGDNLDSLETRLSSVERALAEIQGRVRVLEDGAAPQSVAPVIATRALMPYSRNAETDLVATFTLIGRTFVIFAGAYLLRAWAESGMLDRSTGALLGAAYAATWSVVAYRVAPHHALSATFFGAATVLISFPLLWEATTRFALLTPVAAAIALTAMTGLVLVIAWRRRLHALAWVATIAACGLASLLLVTTGQVIPFAVFLIALGVVTLWLGYDREWTLLRWVTAFFANVVILGLIGRALATPPRDAPARVMIVQLLLLVGYLGSIAIRTLMRGRDVVPFEAVQTSAMLVAGLAGAMIITHQTGAGALMLGPALLVLAAACYAVAFEPRQAQRVNFYFYTSLALVFALAGGALVLDGAALATLWASLAVLVGWAGHRFVSNTLAVHSVVYLVAAALSSGLVVMTFVGLFASANAPWSSISVAGWGVLLAIGICWLLSTPQPGYRSDHVANALRFTLAILAVLSVIGVSIVVMRAALPSSSAASLHAGVVATLRTGVLAAGALIVAWLGRRLATREFGALLYPVLGWGALKLVAEDFRTSSPLLLVVAFALYGGALILAPRIAKMRAPDAR